MSEHRSSDFRGLSDSMDRGHKKAQEVAAATGQKMDDMLFSAVAPDGQESAESIDDFNAAGKVMPFVCARVSSTPAYVPSRRMPCDRCGRQVWMSHATKAVFDRITKKLILCLECVPPPKPET